MHSEQAISASPSGIESIGAIALATHDMAHAVRFYQALGFTLRYGGDASFTSFHTGSGYLNLIAVPAEMKWSWWGRVTFHVESKGQTTLSLEKTRARGLRWPAMLSIASRACVNSSRQKRTD